MLKSIIRTLLQKFIDDIDSDNCNITMEQQSKIISVLSNIANPDYRMSKVQACDYLGVSRATFDNYVRDGFIPKGVKQEGFKELSWQKSDLDIFLSSIIVINRPDSAEEFIDTYNHEKNHVEMHICKEFGIDPYSEKAAYLSGQLAKKLFKAQLRNWIR